MSKRTKTVLILIGVVILCAATIPAAIWVTHTQTAQSENSKRRCEDSTVKHATHNAVIHDNKVIPQHTKAKLCDVLIITNADIQERLVAFGQPDKHMSYDGISEKILRQGQALQVTLIKPGDYRFHDHENEDVVGTFSVQDQTAAELRP